MFRQINLPEILRKERFDVFRLLWVQENFIEASELQDVDNRLAKADIFIYLQYVLASSHQWLYHRWL
jgi:hypothetical protein